MTETRAGDPRTGELLDRRYRLDERIGQGGMATVWRARDEALQRTVAVKIFRDGAGEPLDPRRTRSEITLLASLSHHSLVTLYDAHFGDEGPDFLVMEYVEGHTLSELIAAGPVDAHELAAITVDLAEALHVVHEHGIVHRDVKPSNVLLRPAPIPGRLYRPKLADFGIAYLLESSHLTAANSIVGTAAYLAPEQVRGREASPASDVYALGLVLLEALTGERAFPQTQAHAAMVARLTVSPVVPASLESGWSGLLTSMVAITPEDRPAALEIAVSASALSVDDGDRLDRDMASTAAAVTVAMTDGAVPPRTVTRDAAAEPAEMTSVLPTGEDLTEVLPAADAAAVLAAAPEPAAQPIVRESDAPAASQRARRRPIGLIVVAVLLIIAIAAVATWWFISSSATTPTDLPDLVEPLNTHLRELLEEVTP